MIYYRVMPSTDPARPSDALPLAGGRVWFNQVEVLQREQKPQIEPASVIPETFRKKLTQKRPPVCGLNWGPPRIMGVLNVTPDSFSDGGLHNDEDAACQRAWQMVDEGADMIDIGGESTRPGARFVQAEKEIDRTEPVIRALITKGFQTAISIDTRKAVVARAAVAAGAGLINDVTALRYDSNSLATAAELGVPVCLMHTGGEPENMQDSPSYDDVLLDVYDHLAARITECEAAGIARGKIIVDPGIGFGKTYAHNVALLRRLSLFHGLGCPILLGVSRKGFIGQFGNEPEPEKRFPGSIAVALNGLSQGVQMLRVHDIAQTRQAIALWQALIGEV